MITFQDVSFSYGEKKLFRHLSFSFPETGFVVILGRSGSGKTTLLSLLSGLLLPQEGRITGVDKSDISFVFQSPLLLSYLPVRENVTLVDVFDGEEKDPEEALNLVGINRYSAKSPKQLSGGEQVRTAIARALEKGAGTLILDEPTGQLDEKSSLAIYEKLEELSLDHLILLVTHDETSAPLFATHLYELKSGKLTLLLEKENGQSKKKKRLEKKSRSSSGMNLKNSVKLALPFLKKHKRRVFFAAFFFAFTLALSYLGFDLQIHKEEVIASLFEDYYAGDVTTLSMKKEVAQSGRLHLEKKSCPDEEVIRFLSLPVVYPSLTYFVPPYNEVNLLQKDVDCAFYPVIEEEAKKLSLGRTIQEAEEVVVNESFLSEFGLEAKEALGLSFPFGHTIRMKSSHLVSEDILSLDLTFKIVGISKERKAFNSAAVYYSHPQILKKMKRLSCPEISKELGRRVTAYNLVLEDEFREDDFCGQASLFLSDRPSEKKKEAEKYFGKRVSITSQRLQIEETSTETIRSLLQILLLFFGLNLISAIMLEFLTIYSLYRENLRYFALLKVFHPGKKDVLVSALGIQLLFFVLSVLLFFGLSILGASLINRVTLSFSYPAFFSPFDSVSYLVMILLNLCGSTIAALFPLRKIKEDKIKQQLEGED